MPLWLAVMLGTIMLIRSKITTAATAVAAMLLSSSAFAGAQRLPEPGTWALLGLAAAIGIAVSRKKRK